MYACGPRSGSMNLLLKLISNSADCAVFIVQKQLHRMQIRACCSVDRHPCIAPSVKSRQAEAEQVTLTGRSCNSTPLVQEAIRRLSELALRLLEFRRTWPKKGSTFKLAQSLPGLFDKSVCIGSGYRLPVGRRHAQGVIKCPEPLDDEAIWMQLLEAFLKCMETILLLSKPSNLRIIKWDTRCIQLPLGNSELVLHPPPCVPSGEKSGRGAEQSLIAIDPEFETGADRLLRVVSNDYPHRKTASTLVCRRPCPCDHNRPKKNCNQWPPASIFFHLNPHPERSFAQSDRLIKEER